MKDVSKNLKWNERKALILFLLVKTKKYLYVSDIANALNITTVNAARQMTKLSKRHKKYNGYIHRRKQRYGIHKGEYEYRFLLPKGHRICKELWIRTKLREIDPTVTFNLKKPVPSTLMKLHEQFSVEYNLWKNKL